VYRKVELLGDVGSGERYVGPAICYAWWRRREKLSSECEGMEGAAGIPYGFCLGTVREQSPVALFEFHVGKECCVFVIVEFSSGIKRFGS